MNGSEKQNLYIDPHLANKVLSYNKETGLCVWRKRKHIDFPNTPKHILSGWNTKWAGKIAGTTNNKEYVQVALNGGLFKLHRVIWVLVTGENPKDQVDHINHDRRDNRWSNLRLVSGAENNKNASIPKHNTSGVSGVGIHRQTGKFRAHVSVKNKYIHLGLFNNMDNAIKARESALTKFGFHKNHGVSQ